MYQFLHYLFNLGILIPMALKETRLYPMCLCLWMKKFKEKSTLRIIAEWFIEYSMQNWDAWFSLLGKGNSFIWEPSQSLTPYKLPHRMELSVRNFRRETHVENTYSFISNIAGRHFKTWIYSEIICKKSKLVF